MRAILSAFFLLVPTAAFAHTGHSAEASLLSGLAHPMAGLDHILAMLAVGVFGAVLGGRAIFLVPLSFVLMMLAGFLVGAAGANLPFLELGIALSSIVIGAVAASGKAVPALGAMALVGAFALFHGVTHGNEVPSGTSGFGFALGFLAATALLHGTGIAATLAVSRLSGRFGRPAVQLGAGACALGGVGLLAGWI